MVMAKNYFKSYVWLLETLQSRGALTLKEIKDLWKRSSVNEEGKELATRTFSNHISAIADVFGIDIVCDRRYNTYYIENLVDVGGNSIREWMMDALCLNSLLNECVSLRDRVIFENVPSGRKFLATIIQAIRDNKKLEICYKSFRQVETVSMIVEPYFLKEFKRRWYLYACKNGDEVPHMFALDRIVNVEVLTDTFAVPKELDADDYFGGIYGVRVYPNMKKERVILKVSSLQSQYFRTLPLHKSQKEVETQDDHSIFSYYVTPDYDLRQDILSFGTEVEVLEPKTLREEMKIMIENVLNNYNNENRY